MKQLAYLFVNCIDTLNDWIGKTVSWLIIMMVLVTFVIVVLRYVFHQGWIGLQESVSYMHGLVFMLGIAYTLKQNGHVRVDIFYQRFLTKTKAWINLVGTILLLLPMSLYIFCSSWGYVADAWSIKESSPNPGGLPGIFLFKASILVMAFLLFLQGLAGFVRSLYIIIGSPLEASQQSSSHG